MEAVVFHDFQATHPAQLDVKAGTHVTLPSLVSKVPGYVFCQVISGDSKGYVPFNHLVLLHPTPSDLWSGQVHTVLFDFEEPSNDGYLRVKQGDAVIVLENGPRYDGWALCCCKRQRGFVPRDFLSPAPTPQPQLSYVPLGQVLLVDPALALVKSLGATVKPSHSDKAGWSLLQIFRANGQELRMLRVCIESEVSLTTGGATSDQKSTLMRRNSLNSAALTEMAQQVGAEYLRKAVGPTLETFIKSTESSYEVDPSRIVAGKENVEENQRLLAQRCEEFLDHLTATAHLVPPHIVFICSTLESVIGKVMADARGIAVGSFLMLRFICPNLTAPSVEAGLPQPPADRRRGLLFLSKCVINLVNDVEFGKKEAFMAPFDGLLRKSGKAKLLAFFDAVLARRDTVATLEREAPVLDLTSQLNIVTDSMEWLHLYLSDANVLADVLKEAKSDVITQRLNAALQAAPPLKPQQPPMSARSELEKDFPILSHATAEEKESLTKVVTALRKANDRKVATNAVQSVIMKKADRKKVQEELAEINVQIQTLEASKKTLLETLQKKYGGGKH